MAEIFERLELGALATVDATDDAIEYIADNLRPSDAAELFASTGSKDYRGALRTSVISSDDVVVWVTAYGEPVGIQGVGTLSLLYNTGCPWLVGTPRLNAHLRALAQGESIRRRTRWRQSRTLLRLRPALASVRPWRS